MSRERGGGRFREGGRKGERQRQRERKRNRVGGRESNTPLFLPIPDCPGSSRERLNRPCLFLTNRPCLFLIRMHACMYVCKHAYIHLSASIGLACFLPRLRVTGVNKLELDSDSHVCVCVCVCVYRCIYRCIYVCVHACMHVCMYHTCQDRREPVSTDQ